MKLFSKIFVLCALLLSTLYAADKEPVHRVWLAIGIDCPMSPELQELLETIPDPNASNTMDYPEWMTNFATSITKCIQLLESQQFYHATFVAGHEIEGEQQEEKPPRNKGKKKKPLPHIDYHLECHCP